jgi:hypothetical protein
MDDSSMGNYWHKFFLLPPHRHAKEIGLVVPASRRRVYAKMETNNSPAGCWCHQILPTAAKCEASDPVARIVLRNAD